jgi:uncharacterized protein YecE (DUF72 family)
MAAQAASGMIFFNNHVRGQAPRNAVQLVRLLSKKGLKIERCVIAADT